MQMGIFFRNLRVAEYVGGLAQFPQTPAQQGRAAQRVTVGTAMGEDYIVVVFV